MFSDRRVPYLHAVRAPLPEIPLVPGGGVTLFV
ncbi:hypothetical protein FHX82_006442 [Amycolatopsis bartoniae]|nr:hypothetical protein [Amycolatopsis bartoniae]